MDQWLQNFAYHTDISIVSILVAMVFMTIVVLSTVGGQMWKAMLTNPTEVLRSE